jgi:CRP-like cAMP-binding protein
LADTSVQEARIRKLAPVSRLSIADQQAVLAKGMILNFSAGETVYAQGREDSYANYLLDGAVDFLWNGRFVRALDAEQTPVRRALDNPGPKRYTVRAKSWSTILRIERGELERKLRIADLVPGATDLQVNEISGEEPSSWMIRMLQSQRFSNLPPENIQRIFDRMERVTASSDELLIRQGDPGGYYYVIEQGYCDVSREPAGGGSIIHLAELGPGDGFGEEALVAGTSRNASVTMRSDGVLMRLDKEGFIELIRDPLINEVSYEQARAMMDQGGVWVDVRHRDQFAHGSLPNARNIPRAVLRAECRKLVKGRKYVVCAEDYGDSAVCAFLLAERGYDVSYLSTPLSELFASEESAMHRPEPAPERSVSATVVQFPPSDGDEAEEQPAPPPTPERTDDARDAAVVDMEEGFGPSDPVPRQEYADTVTGERLANLVDEINNRYQDLASASDNTRTGDTLIEGVLRLSDLEEQAREGPSVEEIPEPPESAADIPTGAPEPPAKSPTAPPDPRSVDLVIPEQELSEITRELDLRLRRWLNAFASAQRLQYEEQLQARTEQLKQIATRELHRKAQEIRSAYRAKYQAKEDALRRHYGRLMRLANKITRQKAEIQNARRELEEKLKATDHLYREVDEIRRMLKQRIGNLDGLESDEGPSQSAS